MIRTELHGLWWLVRLSVPFLVTTLLYAWAFLKLEEVGGDHLYRLPGQMGSVFGIAIAFFLGFRMNSAYDRWWEARKIYGELTNTARSFVAKVAGYYGNDRHIAARSAEDRGERAVATIDLVTCYVRRLTQEMHGRDAHALSDDDRALLTRHGIDLEHKISNGILVHLSRRLEADFVAAANIEKRDLADHVGRFYDIQGKAERIRNTPFLMIYGAFTRIVVTLYVLLLPLFVGDIDVGGEQSGLEILAVPIISAISTAFLTINALANSFGEPFAEHRVTSVPIDTITSTIEDNCREVRGIVTSDGWLRSADAPAGHHRVERRDATHLRRGRARLWPEVSARRPG